MHGRTLPERDPRLADAAIGLDAAPSEAGALPSRTVAAEPLSDFELTPTGGDPRPLSDWLTTFPLVTVVLDPFTYESSWILDTARRILATYRDADCRVAWTVTADVEGATKFLGPLADEFLTFADSDRNLARGAGLSQLPAFVVIRQDATVAATAEGWDPAAWRSVAQTVTDLTRWNRPTIPAAGDPVAYAGTPALG